MIELPRIDYEPCAGRPYRYVWGVGRRDPAGDFLDRSCKHRRREPATRNLVWREAAIPASRCSSPNRAATRKARACCCRSCSMRGAARSFLLVLDAMSLAEIARAECPHHIPFGFHGNYFPSRAT